MKRRNESNCILILPFERSKKTQKKDARIIAESCHARANGALLVKWNVMTHGMFADIKCRTISCFGLAKGNREQSRPLGRCKWEPQNCQRRLSGNKILGGIALERVLRSLWSRCKWEQVISLTMIDRSVSAARCLNFILIPFSPSRIENSKINEWTRQKKRETFRYESALTMLVRWEGDQAR